MFIRRISVWFRDQPRRQWFLPVLVTLVVTMIMMIGYELLMEAIFPHLSQLQKHVATIAFTGVLAAIVAYIAIRLYAELLRHTADEMSQRLRLNDELGQERMLMRSLMDNTPDHIYFKDAEGRYLRVNRSQASAFGMENPGDIVGHTDYDFFSAEHARQAEKDEGEILKTGRPVIGREEREQWPDGRVTWVSTTRVPLRDRRGRTIGTFGISRDITEIHRVEERTRQLFHAVEQSPSVTIITDVRGRIEYVNPRFTEVNGYTADEVIGKSPSVLKSGQMPESHYKALWDTITRGDVWKGEVLNRRKNGELYWGRATISPIRNVRGEITHFVSVLEDITEQRAAAQALQESETKYRMLVEQIPAIVYRSEPGKAGRWSFVSPQIEHLLGFTTEEWLADPSLWWGQIAEEDRERVLAEETRAVGTSGAMVVEYRMTSKEGRSVWFRDMAHAVTTPSGTYLQGIMLDITDRRRAEASSAIEQARRRELERILNLSPIIIFVWRNAPGWPVEFVSDNIRQFGYEPEEFTGGRRPYASIVHPGDLQRIGAEVTRYSADHVDEFTQEYRILSKDGETIWIDDRTWVRRDAQGAVTHYQGIAIDISARKRAEQMQKTLIDGLRAVLESADELIACTETDTLFLRAVELARERLGIERCAIMLDDGDHIRGSFGTDMNGRTTDERHNRLPKAEPWTQRFRPRQANEPRWSVATENQVEWGGSSMKVVNRGWVAITPIQSDDEVLGIFCNDCAISRAPMDPVLQEVIAVYCSLIANILVRRRIEDERRAGERRQREAMERADRLTSLGMLAAGMAHEINNPLQGMLSHLHAVQNLLPPGFQGRESLAMVERGVEIIAGLVRKLLVLGTTTESQGVESSAVESLDFVSQLLASQFQRSGVLLRREAVDNTVKVTMPKQELVQVLMNLLLNAKDATPKGGSVTMRMETEGEVGVISIRDTGAGMTPEVIKRIFTPFFTTKGTKGSGLGLSVAESLVRQHGGSIDVDSKPGSGSTFCIRLPLAKGQQDERTNSSGG